MDHTHEIKRLDHTKLLFIGKGILIGGLAGFCISLFRFLIENALHYTKIIYTSAHPHPIILIPWIFFMLLIAWSISLLIRSEADIKGSGIPQIEGELQGVLQQNWSSVLWKKFLGGVLSVGAGLFLGREGPSIQLGAMIGKGFSIKTQATTSEKKIFMSSGAAAGLAAAFNAPIAGLLFVIEEIHHTFSPLIWLTSLAAALTANFVSLNFFGLKPVLYLGKIPQLPLRLYGHLVLLGVLLGICGYLYQHSLLALPKLFRWTRLPNYFYGVIPFLLIVPIGYYFPSSLGGGNQLILAFTYQHFSILFLIGLFFLRFVFSMISYGGNLPGGIFLPILTLGALLGGLYGTLLHSQFGMDSQFIRDFVVFSMAAYFTAIGKAPLTAIILVSEMVGSFMHLMPLAVCSLTAYIVNDFLGGDPIYESLLERLIKHPINSIDGSKTIIEYPVTVESALDGRMVRDVYWPKEMLLISIRRGSSEILTHGDTVMRAGDQLIILTDAQHAKQIKQHIRAASQTYI
ncbi:ATP synthase F0 subunit A [Enterococcus florum]|uniref:ATP synthase F0 subunit A n=1 Tax=Enterococcus florum TaxID=2480627 RepID=A0A4P5P9B9_9ENTE|nr:ClC family H(+)/Cl(-) exchange transporter [Enterococcus florum]GCF94500.1 ATP synthase F0 subunit A [Enterococcus florum]